MLRRQKEEEPWEDRRKLSYSDRDKVSLKHFFLCVLFLMTVSGSHVSASRELSPPPPTPSKVYARHLSCIQTHVCIQNHVCLKRVRVCQGSGWPLFIYWRKLNVEMDLQMAIDHSTAMQPSTFLCHAESYKGGPSTTWDNKCPWPFSPGL